MKRYKNKGFTLVEVLICVGIIGIIAAITIPALLSSTSEKALEAQRKALHSRMAQAFGQIQNLKLYELSTLQADGVTYNDTFSASNFVNMALSKVYKLSGTCDSTSIRECGIPDIVHDYYSDTLAAYDYPLTQKHFLGEASGLNEKITLSALGGLNANYAAFKTANGESILLYYNPKCVSKSEADQTNMFRSVCVNMIYDLNGRNKAPNAYGEDIGYITVFYPSDPVVVMPILYHNQDGNFAETTFEAMLANATEKELVPPTIEELVSIIINKNLTFITKDLDASKLFWSSSYSSDNTDEAWTAGINIGLKKQAVSGAGVTNHGYYLIKK